MSTTTQAGSKFEMVEAAANALCLGRNIDLGEAIWACQKVLPPWAGTAIPEGLTVDQLADQAFAVYVAADRGADFYDSQTRRPTMTTATPSALPALAADVLKFRGYVARGFAATPPVIQPSELDAAYPAWAQIKVWAWDRNEDGETEYGATHWIVASAAEFEVLVTRPVNDEDGNVVEEDEWIKIGLRAEMKATKGWNGAPMPVPPLVLDYIPLDREEPQVRQLVQNGEGFDSDAKANADEAAGDEEKTMSAGSEIQNLDDPYPFLVPSNLCLLLESRITPEEAAAEAAKSGYRRISKRSSGDLQDHNLYLEPAAATRVLLRGLELMGYTFTTSRRPDRSGWTIVVHMEAVGQPVSIEDWEAAFGGFGEDYDPGQRASVIAAARVLAGLVAAPEA